MNDHLKKIKTGSVKDIFQVGESNRGGEKLYFSFSDRYSIFDWGVMPDSIEEKGKSLLAQSYFFFQFLGDKNNWENWGPKGNLNSAATNLWHEFKAMGVPHHMKGLANQNGNQTTDWNEAEYLVVNQVDVHKPEFKDGDYDYSFYQTSPTNTLVPLEIVFRFGVPEGSSLLKRANDREYLKQIGLTNSPRPGEVFDHPIIEFSTKLESTDRYLSYQEAKSIAGLNDREFDRLKAFCQLVSLRLKDLFNSMEIELWDGKLELAFSFKASSEIGRRFYLVDSLGPDEMRLICSKRHLSKEAIRQIYKGSDWAVNVEKAKKLANERNERDWKSICLNELKSHPSSMGPEYQEFFSDLYKVLANSLYSYAELPVPFASNLNLKDLIANWPESEKKL